MVLYLFATSKTNPKDTIFDNRQRKHLLLLVKLLREKTTPRFVNKAGVKEKDQKY
jgi:hypothetical protein